MQKNKQDLKFPNKKTSSKKIKKMLELRALEIPNWKTEKAGFRVSFPQTYPHKISLYALSRFLPLNQNNGRGDIDSSSTGTARLEYEVIRMVSNLVNGNNVEGYISTGGTESNIEAVWIAKKIIGKRKTILIKTILTHHSIDKAADILDIETINVPLNKNYTLDSKKMQDIIETQIKKGITGFIVIATAGYTATGTVDEIYDISKRIDTIKKENNIRILLHVDASFGGFVLPFLNSERSFDFRIKNVSSMALDMHKMGFVPYSAGIFLCRNGMRKGVSRLVEYTNAIDSTLSGSRQGAYAAACWATLQNLGRAGYTEIIKKCIENKKWMIKSLNRIFKNITIIEDKDMNVFAMNFGKSKDQRLPKNIEEKYGLNPININKKIFYRIYVMPHVTRGMLKKMVADFKNQI